jgi:hypothetical protein
MRQFYPVGDSDLMGLDAMEIVRVVLQKPTTPPCRRCSWCRSPLPERRAGRRGRHSFCGLKCQAAFDRGARAIGHAVLDEGPGAAAAVLKKLESASRKAPRQKRESRTVSAKNLGPNRESGGRTRG